MSSVIHKKRIEAEKNGDKDGKTLYKLMNNAVYGKTIENLKIRIDVRLVSNKKDLVAIRKSKVTLTLNKPAYVRMCILDLSRVLMYKFHYDYIKNKANIYKYIKLLFHETGTVIYEIKIEDV